MNWVIIMIIIVCIIIVSIITVNIPSSLDGFSTFKKSLKLLPVPEYFNNTILFSEKCYYDSVIGKFGKDLQNKLDQVYNIQQKNEFSDQRYALLFLPGTYRLHIKVGYYTSVLGLGKRPRDVTIYGNVEAENQGEKSEPFPGALNNFWRSCENIKIIPEGGKMMWRVSQASPLRSVHIVGDLYLSEAPGYASGGYLADCLVDGNIKGGVQQQWMSRNSQYNSFDSINWNSVCVGNRGNITGNQKCKQGQGLWSIIDKTPIVASKPYLYWDNVGGSYKVLVPDINYNSKGVLIWSNGQSIPLEYFYCVKLDDSVDTLNDYLNIGYSLLFSPGIYKYNKPINITKPETVILGLGFATISGILNISDSAVGVRVAGIMIQADQQDVSTLVKVGDTPKSGDKTKPTILSDIFVRVGGPKDDVSCDTMFTINQSHVIVDNTWLWRADHSNFGGIGEVCKGPNDPTGMITCGIGPNNAMVNHCLVVNGDFCTIYGLAAEHTQQELIVWNGDDGKVYFFQSELPYDVSVDWNYPAFRLGDTTKKFFGVGLGVYSYFVKLWNKNVNGPQISTAIHIPQTNTNIIQSAFSVLLNPSMGNGNILHVINDKGGSSSVANPDSPVWCSLNSDLCNIC